jgi:hypothetical protein
MEAQTAGDRDEMMESYAGTEEAWEVAAEVGNVRNNRPELMDRVGLL